MNENVNVIVAYNRERMRVVVVLHEWDYKEECRILSLNNTYVRRIIKYTNYGPEWVIESRNCVLYRIRTRIIFSIDFCIFFLNRACKWRTGAIQIIKWQVVDLAFVLEPFFFFKNRGHLR